MKVPFKLHKRQEADAVRGLLLLGEGVGELLALWADLGCDPPPATFAVPGGYLLKLLEPSAHAYRRTIRLRRLSPDLFLPADADLLPPLLDDEARALVRDRGLVFLPGGRVLSYEPDRPLQLANVLRVAVVHRRAWVALPAGPERAERLHEILLDVPEESGDEVLEAGSEGIGTEEPLPDDASLPAKVSGMASMGLGKAFLKAGDALGWAGLSKLGAKLVQSALERAPRLSEALLGAQEAALRALLREFRGGDLEKALRRALPLGGDGDRGGTVAGNANLPTHNVRYSLANILGAGNRDGGASVWFAGGDVQVQLSAEYRKAAAAAAARGDYRRAAFIYGKLLRDYRLAADVLARGGLHHDAAILYLDKLDDKLAAGRAFEAAGEFDRALQLYRQRGEHLLAAEVLRKTGEEEEALAEYTLAADKLVAKQHNYLAAAELMLDRAGRLDLALDYLRQGWAQRPGGTAVACLLRLAALHAEAETPDAFLALLAEADAYFAPPGHEAIAGQFYNEVARLAGQPQLVLLRDDLRDRALVGLANKLRQRSAVEQKPGAQAAALFARTTLWAPAQVHDAEFAFKAALRPSRKPSAPRVVNALNPIHLGNGQITALCAAPETGQVFIGFDSGRLVGFDPRSTNVVEFPASSCPVTVVSTDPSGQLVVVIHQKSEVRSRCTSYVRNSIGLYEKGHERSPAAEQMTQIVAADEFYFALYSENEFDIVMSQQMVPVARLGRSFDHCPSLVWDSILLIDPTKKEFGGVEAVCFYGPGAVFFVNTADRTSPGSPLSWNVQPPADALVRQASLTWFQEDGAHCEVARISASGGGVYWSHLHRDQGRWRLHASGVAAGHSGYDAVTILRPGRLAAVREGRVVWLRPVGNWLMPWSTQDLALPASSACFFSPHTNELTVITRDNHAICLPVPNG